MVVVEVVVVVVVVVVVESERDGDTQCIAWERSVGVVLFLFVVLI